MVVRGVDGTSTPVGTVAEGVLSVGGQQLRLDGALVMDALPEPVIVGRPGLGALDVTQAWGSRRTLMAGKELRVEGEGEAIVAVDELSGFVVARWLRSKDAASLAEQIEFGVGRARGIPRRIRADAAFDTAVVRATCQRLGIDLRVAAIGVHNSTGLVERTQATLRLAMARCPRGTNDDMWLARAVVRVNETFSRGRGSDPASLWAGRKVRTEVEVASGAEPEREMEDRDAAAVTQREKVTPGKLIAEAWEQPDLVVGSRVDFCYQPAQQSKLEAIDKWYGPVVVVRRGPLDASVMSLGRRKVVFNFLPINAVRPSRIPSKWMRLPPAAASQVEKEMGLVSRAAHRMGAQAAKRAAEVARVKQHELQGQRQEAKARSRVQESSRRASEAERPAERKAKAAKGTDGRGRGRQQRAEAAIAARGDVIVDAHPGAGVARAGGGQEHDGRGAVRRNVHRGGEA
mmetsp:Transcript_10201/g.32341  ORF Transcript_10201/g.32341 Transcript_10201/m.32341 type:complete len:459 (-) Transcript_10201:398-1774(-)